MEKVKEEEEGEEKRGELQGEEGGSPPLGQWLRQAAQTVIQEIIKTTIRGKRGSCPLLWLQGREGGEMGKRGEIEGETHGREVWGMEGYEVADELMARRCMKKGGEKKC